MYFDTKGSEMAITKRPPKAPEKNLAEDAFISGAPDAGSEKPSPKRVRKGKKIQITLTISEPLLDRVDELADQLGQSRAGVINLGIVQMLERGLILDKNGE